MSVEDRQRVAAEVRRYAEEYGVSLAEAQAERRRWEAEAAINRHSRLVANTEAEVRRLAAELRAQRGELRQRRRRLQAALNKRDRASLQINGLRGYDGHMG